MNMNTSASIMGGSLLAMGVGISSEQVVMDVAEGGGRVVCYFLRYLGMKGGMHQERIWDLHH